MFELIKWIFILLFFGAVTIATCGMALVAYLIYSWLTHAEPDHKNPFLRSF